MYKGILEDNRPQGLKDKDYDERELDMGTTKWFTKKEAEKNAKDYTFRNQYQKSSCVPSSICNALWNTEGITLADEYLYSQRINKPQEGCYWYDQADKVIAQGVCGRVFLKEVKTEKEANEVIPTAGAKKDASFQKQKSYINITKPTVNVLGKWSNQGYAVPFSIFATSKEWSQEYPTIIDTKLTIEKAPINHAICVIPSTGYIEKKKKYVIITDSSHFGKIHTRHLSEEFLKARAKHGVVFTDLSKETSRRRHENYIFAHNLTVGSTGPEVKILQETLQDLGFFPADFNCTEYFGGITRQAVKDFQKKYEKSILWVVGLKTPTGYFGPATRKVISNL